MSLQGNKRGAPLGCKVLCSAMENQPRPLSYINIWSYLRTAEGTFTESWHLVEHSVESGEIETKNRIDDRAVAEHHPFGYLGSCQVESDDPCSGKCCLGEHDGHLGLPFYDQLFCPIFTKTAGKTRPAASGTRGEQGAHPKALPNRLQRHPPLAILKHTTIDLIQFR